MQAGCRLALAKALRDHFDGGLTDRPSLVADAVDLVYHVQLRVEWHAKHELVQLIERADDR